MKECKIEFDDYVRMVRKMAHFYAKCYHMDYEDVESQGFLIYCVSLEKYKKGKASFSTHLYINLRGRLKDYCEQVKCRKCNDVSLNALLESDFEHGLEKDCFPAREEGPSDEQFLLYAELYLSSSAYKVLKWLLTNRLSEFRSKTNPALKSISKKLNIKYLTLDLIWQEITDFWNIRGAAFYACN